MSFQSLIRTPACPQPSGMGQGWDTATRDEIGDQDSAGAPNPSLITVGQNWRRKGQGLMVPKIVRAGLDLPNYMGCQQAVP